MLHTLKSPETSTKTCMIHILTAIDIYRQKYKGAILAGVGRTLHHRLSILFPPTV